MDKTGCLGNRNHLRMTQRPRQCDGSRRHAMHRGTFDQRGIIQNVTLPQGRIGHSHTTRLRQIGQEIKFNAPLTRMIQDLVGGAGIARGNAGKLFHVRDIEI